MQIVGFAINWGFGATELVADEHGLITIQITDSTDTRLELPVPYGMETAVQTIISARDAGDPYPQHNTIHTAIRDTEGLSIEIRDILFHHCTPISRVVGTHPAAGVDRILQMLSREDQLGQTLADVPPQPTGSRVQSDLVQDMLVAMKRAGLLTIDEMMAMRVAYLRTNNTKDHGSCDMNKSMSDEEFDHIMHASDHDLSINDVEFVLPEFSE